MLNNDGSYSYKLPLQVQQQFEYSLKHIPYTQQMYTYRVPQYHQQSQLQLQQLLQPHYINQLEYIPELSIYDYLHRPAHIYNAVLGEAESKSDIDGQTTSWYIDALENDAEEDDTNIYNTKGNELTSDHKTLDRRIQGKGAGGGSSSTNVDSFTNGGALEKNVSDKVHVAALEDNVLVNGADNERNDDNADYRMRYFYGVPNKHPNMKK